MRDLHSIPASAEQAAGPNVWPVAIRRRVFVGDLVQYHLDWHGTELRTRQLPLTLFDEGQAAYIVDTPAGPIVIPITAEYKDTPDLRYVLLTPEARPHACLTVPPRWRDTDSELLS